MDIESFGAGIILKWTPGDIDKQLAKIQEYINTKKINVNLDFNSNNVEIIKQVNNTQKQVEKTFAKPIKIDTLLGDLDKQKLEKTIREVRDSFGEIAKIDINTDEAKNIESALITYKDGMGKVVQETMEWKTQVLETGQELKTFETTGFKFSDDLEKANKEAEKLVNTMADFREKSELGINKENNVWNLKQDQAINKNLEQEYKLRQKALEDEKKRKQEASDYARKLTYEEEQDRLKNTTDIQKRIERMITGSNETIVQQQKRMFSSENNGNTYEQIWLQAEKAQNKYFEDVELSIRKVNNSLEKMKIGKDKVFSDDRVKKEVAELKLLEDQYRKGEISLKSYQTQMDRVRVVSAQVSNEFRNLQKDGYDFTSMLALAVKKIALWGIGTNLIYGSFNQLKMGLQTLKELDSAMVEIAKVTDLTTESLNRLKDASFDSASAYGRTAQDFLASVAEFSRAGYDSLASGLAEMSLLAQNVGELTSEQANAFLLATDAAYKYKGSQEELGSVLDGVNQIDKLYCPIY